MIFMVPNLQEFTIKRKSDKTYLTTNQLINALLFGKHQLRKHRGSLLSSLEHSTKGSSLTQTLSSCMEQNMKQRV